MDVHNELGSGFLEAVYQEAMSIVLEEEQIPFTKEQKLQICFRGKTLKKSYSADFICYDKIIVELKAVDSISSTHISQVINYLKAAKVKLGLLINFGSKKLQYKRIIN